MQDNIIKQTEDIDKISASNISELLTLEEASKIVSIWGKFLEHIEIISILFGLNIPESILPYPKYLLVGAINKMASHYHNQGNQELVNALETTLWALTSYISDDEAIRGFIQKFSNEDFFGKIIPELKKMQEDRVFRGYVVDNDLYRISQERMEEIKNKWK